ncbi:hypothetical protein BLNAU_24396 [Blattamonas nauphoetae]|uniref:Uncharacterized protein n=1 Tax=Blattamonas nauphoetae TaxID=2049346 RepID=A0ABQ9WMJ1_9EUKA|nr:hypothetical protein BLNAU_24396 [Blattamonas nauphoetae]
MKWPTGPFIQMETRWEDEYNARKNAQVPYFWLVFQLDAATSTDRSTRTVTELVFGTISHQPLTSAAFQSGWELHNFANHSTDVGGSYCITEYTSLIIYQVLVTVTLHFWKRMVLQIVHPAFFKEYLAAIGIERDGKSS